MRPWRASRAGYSARNDPQGMKRAKPLVVVLLMWLVTVTILAVGLGMVNGLNLATNLLGGAEERAGTLPFTITSLLQLAVLLTGCTLMWNTYQKDRFNWAAALSLLTPLLWVVTSLLTPLLQTLL